MKTVKDEVKDVSGRWECESKKGAGGSTILCRWVGEYRCRTSAEVMS